MSWLGGGETGFAAGTAVDVGAGEPLGSAGIVGPAVATGSVGTAMGVQPVALAVEGCQTGGLELAEVGAALGRQSAGACGGSDQGGEAGADTMVVGAGTMFVGAGTMFVGTGPMFVGAADEVTFHHGGSVVTGAGLGVSRGGGF